MLPPYPNIGARTIHFCRAVIFSALREKNDRIFCTGAKKNCCLTAFKRKGTIDVNRICSGMSAGLSPRHLQVRERLPKCCLLPGRYPPLIGNREPDPLHLPDHLSQDPCRLSIHSAQHPSHLPMTAWLWNIRTGFRHKEVHRKSRIFFLYNLKFSRIHSFHLARRLPRPFPPFFFLLFPALLPGCESSKIAIVRTRVAVIPARASKILGDCTAPL